MHPVVNRFATLFATNDACFKQFQTAIVSFITTLISYTQAHPSECMSFLMLVLFMAFLRSYLSIVHYFEQGEIMVRLYSRSYTQQLNFNRLLQVKLSRMDRSVRQATQENTRLKSENASCKSDMTVLLTELDSLDFSSMKEIEMLLVRLHERYTNEPVDQASNHSSEPTEPSDEPSESDEQSDEPSADESDEPSTDGDRSSDSDYTDSD